MGTLASGRCQKQACAVVAEPFADRLLHSSRLAGVMERLETVCVVALIQEILLVAASLGTS